MHKKYQMPKAMMALLMLTLAPYLRLSQYKKTVLLHSPRSWPHPVSNLLGDLGQASSLL